MPSNLIVVNSHMEFIVPDSKVELVLALLFEVATGAQNVPETKDSRK